jgi:transposase
VDRGKAGVKRSLLTEAAGVPVGLAVGGANEVDFKLLRQTVQSIPIERPEPTKGRAQGMCLDKGYDYLEVWELLEAFGFTAHVAVRGGDADSQPVKRKARHKARRWVVERTHRWMNRFRGILVRWSKKPENYLAQLHLVCAVITYRCAGLFG